MIGSSARFAKLKFGITVVCVLSILGGLALIGLGFASEAAERIWLIAGGVCAVLAACVVSIASYLLIKLESNSHRMYLQMLEMHELAQRHSTTLQSIADNSALSDGAKSLTHREKEYESLRATIRTDLNSESWDAALHLVDEMERRFGYAEEAADLRKEIVEHRADAMRTKLAEARAAVEKDIEAGEWDKARQEIDRLTKALPDERSVTRLRSLLEKKRTERKQELLKEWDETIKRNDIDEAIRVISELDQYLTREEASTLEETARTVFKEKLMQLGMQFRFAVSERRWRDALEIGLEIVEEYPNSRMAREVNEAMDGLRRRAGATGDVEVILSKRSQ